MSKVKQTVYLLTEQQRDALVNYLQNQPFREVASGIQFLISAPTAVLNVETPDEAQGNSIGVSEASESPAEVTQLAAV